MFSTISQPYIPWKGEKKYSKVSSWSRPIYSDEITDNDNGIPFKPRPIKHWRKSLFPINNRGKTGKSSLFDYPGSTNSIRTDEDCDNSFNVLSVTNLNKNKNLNFSNGEKVPSINGSFKCISCTPESKIIRSGMNEKLINPVNSSSHPKKKYSFSTKEYLKRKCKTYAQNLSGTKDPSIQYVNQNGSFIPYSDSINGTQIRLANTCEELNCQKKIIVKPNNIPFFKQGAVSSSSRLERIKLNTITKNGASFLTAWGLAASNAGKYRADGNAPYFIKSKNNICSKTTYHKNGNKTSCNSC